MDIKVDLKEITRAKQKLKPSAKLRVNLPWKSFMQNVDTSALGILFLVLFMPYVAAFHVAQGAPWAFCATLVEAVCIGAYVYFNRSVLKETYLKQEVPTAEPLETSQKSIEK